MSAVTITQAYSDKADGVFTDLYRQTKVSLRIDNVCGGDTKFCMKLISRFVAMVGNDPSCFAPKAHCFKCKACKDSP